MVAKKQMNLAYAAVGSWSSRGTVTSNGNPTVSRVRDIYRRGQKATAFVSPLLRKSEPTAGRTRMASIR